MSVFAQGVPASRTSRMSRTLSVSRIDPVNSLRLSTVSSATAAYALRRQHARQQQHEEKAIADDTRLRKKRKSNHTQPEPSHSKGTERKPTENFQREEGQGKGRIHTDPGSSKRERRDLTCLRVQGHRTPIRTGPGTFLQLFAGERYTCRRENAKRRARRC